MPESCGPVSRGGALQGIRVLEISGVGPAPFCGMVLADFGAEVIRIDRPAEEGKRRRGGSRVTGRGRRSVTLNLKTDEGREAFLQLAGTSDVVIEGMRPGVVERLGIGPSQCAERNARLIYGRVTGWGQTGLLATTAGHDINYLALTGALHHVGERGRRPVPPLNLVGDYGGGGLLLAFGIVAALHSARETGVGQVVDAAMLDGASLLMSYIHGMRDGDGWIDEREANVLDGGAPYYRTYLCSDGAAVAVGAIEPQFYEIFVKGLGLFPQELPDRAERANWPALEKLFADSFAAEDRAHWTSAFEGTDACVTPVLSIPEAIAHPHNRLRDSFIYIGETVLPAPAPRLSRTPGRIGDLNGVAGSGNAELLMPPEE